MRPQEIQDLVELPEEEALQSSFDRSNQRALVALSLLFAAISLGILIAAVSAPPREPTVALLSAVNLAGNLLLFFRRAHPDLPGAVRRWLLLYMVLEAGYLLAQVGDEGTAILVAGVLFPLLLLRLRLRTSELAFLAVLLPISAWFVLARITSSAQGNGPTGPTIGIAFLSLTATWFAVWRTRVARRRFLVDWRRAAGEARERSRMRAELAFAREIQLGMLPASTPGLPWLEVAASCEPAAEVGGDYYDWFVLSPTRVALVVGDVAGHGVASGLVLAGVRSCLYLLRRELGAPADVAARLDEVVREAGARRMFMALLLVVLDIERGEARIVCAGHPPVLRRPASGGTAEALGVASPPLGTRLGASFVEQVVPIAAGDLLLLHSDGVPESTDPGGQPFGDERVVRCLEGDAATSAAALCEQLLAALRTHRGGRPPEDDCTLLATRIGALPETDGSADGSMEGRA